MMQMFAMEPALITAIKEIQQVIFVAQVMKMIAPEVEMQSMNVLTIVWMIALPKEGVPVEIKAEKMEMCVKLGTRIHVH